MVSDVAQGMVARIGAMPLHVDVARRGLDFAIALNDVAVAVDEQQVFGPHLRPVHAVRIDQVAFLGPRHDHGEMIADALGVTELFCKAEGGGKLAAQVQRRGRGNGHSEPRSSGNS